MDSKAELGVPPASGALPANKLSFMGKFARLCARRLDPYYDIRHLEIDEAGDTHWLENIAEPEAPEPEPAEVVPQGPDTSGLVWSSRRLNVVEQLWGDGYIMPGGEEFVKEHLPMLALTEKMSLLLVGASLCGIGRTLVDETGVWVTGYEDNEELAALGKEREVLYAMQRRAPVNKAKYGETEFKKKSFDAVLSLERIYTVENKKELFAQMVDGMRTDGELLYTDFVLPDTNPPNDAVKAWIAAQPVTPHLWPGEVTQAYLASLNVDARPLTDITRAYRNRVLVGWLNFLSTMNKERLLKIADDVIAECEHWAVLMNAIDSGGLKVYQYHAFKLMDRKKPQ